MCAIQPFVSIRHYSSLTCSEAEARKSIAGSETWELGVSYFKELKAGVCTQSLSGWERIYTINHWLFEAQTTWAHLITFASFAPGVPPWKTQSTWLQRQIFECRPLTCRLSTHNIPATAQWIHNQNRTSAKLAHCETSVVSYRTLACWEACWSNMSTTELILIVLKILVKLNLPSVTCQRFLLHVSRFHCTSDGRRMCNPSSLKTWKEFLSGLELNILL